ncbi:DUF930 domain-containing protein [Mesorhizobium intechi]|uniref:DUF930 domain-containing protein n=1 Tax=Mesorhizobium intechi TaxID=537601 RepID=UPI000CA83B7F|nr:DUF930 domain-containing protein [Mesorhizobium intechi]TSE13824.1 DUF930 domain-containing protein [Mesorhizobium intechi]
MKDEARERRRYLLWGIPASLLLHVLAAALLVYGLPVPPQQPREEQPVNVAIVPPPDPPKPKPVPMAPKPPEPKVEKPPEQKVEKQPQSEQQPRKPPPGEVLRPVFQFGDKDTGPRKSLDGANAQDSSASPAKDDDSKPKPADSQPVTPAGSEPQAASPAETDKQQAAKQQPDKEAALEDAKRQGEAPAPLAADSGGEIELPTSAEAPKPKPANAPKPSSSRASKSASRNDSGLPGVRRLYSQGATGDALATTSMGGVPRGQRAAKLCASALQQELLDASYFPKWVPSIPLKAGNILDAPDVAFSTTTTWYHLGFRCEVDTDATRVLSFNFRVGALIPPSEWVGLRLPSPY